MEVYGQSCPILLKLHASNVLLVWVDHDFVVILWYDISYFGLGRHTSKLVVWWHLLPDGLEGLSVFPPFPARQKAQKNSSCLIPSTSPSRCIRIRCWVFINMLDTSLCSWWWEELSAVVHHRPYWKGCGAEPSPLDAVGNLQHIPGICEFKAWEVFYVIGIHRSGCKMKRWGLKLLLCFFCPRLSTQAIFCRKCRCWKGNLRNGGAPDWLRLTANHLEMSDW